MGDNETNDVYKKEEVYSVEPRDDENIEKWSLWIMPLKKKP